MAREKKVTGILPRVSKLSLMLLVPLIAACDGTVFHDFRSVNGSRWHRNDTLAFLYGSSYDKDAVGYSLSVEARVDASYSYRNLVARVECISKKDNSLIVADTLCCELFGSDGHRKGSTAGILYQVSSAPVTIDVAGGDTVVVRVSHIMDAVEIDGVSDVGVRLSSSYAHGQHQSSGK